MIIIIIIIITIIIIIIIIIIITIIIIIIIIIIINKSNYRVDRSSKNSLKLISNVTFKSIPCCCPRQAKDLFNQFVSGLGKCMSNLLLRMSDVLVMHPRLCSKENFGEPFGLPSISAGVPRPPSWLPELISSLFN